jgi:PTS system mannose-specific IID component
MAIENSAVGLILCFGIMIFTNVFVRYWFFMGGYKQGVSFITSKQNLIKGLTAAVTIMGLVVIGTMIPSTVKITTPLVFTNNDAVQPIQEILNKVFPYLLPVLVTFGVYKGLGTNKMTTAKMVWLIIAICIAATFFGIL